MRKLFIITVFLFCSHMSFAQTVDSVRSESDDRVFTRVEKDAEFPGGLTGWRNFLIANLNTEVASNAAPKKVKRWKQTVLVQFIVDLDGSVSNVKVVNEVHPDLAKEAVRVITKSAGWIPAEQNGRKVKAFRTQPITFIVE